MIKAIIDMWRKIFEPETPTETEAHRMEVAEERLMLVRQRIRALQDFLERRAL